MICGYTANGLDWVQNGKPCYKYKDAKACGYIDGIPYCLAKGSKWGW